MQGHEPAVSYKRHRFPPPIIAHAVWLYYRFPLSLRLVEELLLERGIVVSCETIRCWAVKFGPQYARRLRRKQPGLNDIWHLDEVAHRYCKLEPTTACSCYELRKSHNASSGTVLSKPFNVLRYDSFGPMRILAFTSFGVVFALYVFFRLCRTIATRPAQLPPG